jgi:hypothetical protein
LCVAFSLLLARRAICSRKGPDQALQPISERSKLEA